MTVTTAPIRTATRVITMVQALNEALREEMARDPSVFVIGEDVGAIGGIFGVTEGLQKEFGRDRVIDTPISEPGFTGLAVGAAIVGARPVVELQIMDLLALAMDQIVNHAAKLHYSSAGQIAVPLVVRGPTLQGTVAGAPHSQNLEGWFAHVPGLKVVKPSTPYDAKGLLKSAIRDDNPVIFFEERITYSVRGDVPDGEYLVPIGVADIKRRGTAATIVASGAQLHNSLRAADQLARDGIEVEVIDPRTLRPLDVETIAGSVRRTGRLVVVDDGWKTGGFASSVAAEIGEVAFDYLDAAIRRVAAKDAPSPIAENLDAAIRPQLKDIIAAVKETLAPAG